MQAAQRGDIKNYPREIEEQEPKEYLPSDIDSLRNDYRPANTKQNQPAYRQDIEYRENLSNTKRPTSNQNFEYIQGADQQYKGTQNSRSIYNTYQNGSNDEGYTEENDTFERLDKQNTTSFNRADENINDVQGLRSALEEYKKQIALLEVSLYNETLTNEEQRAYIEVLKQALEVRMNDTGLMNFIKTLNHKSGLSETDLFVEINNIKTLSDSLQREKKSNEEKFREMAKQLDYFSNENSRIKESFAEVAQENQTLSSEMAKILDTLTLLQSENTKLNQEKDSLLDYIEEMRGRFDQIAEENTSQKDIVQNLESKASTFQEKNRDLSEKFAVSEENNYELRRKIDELTKNLNELQKNYNELENKADMHLNNHQVFVEKNASLENNHRELQVDLEKQKLDNSSLNKKFEELERTHKEVVEKLQTTVAQTKELQSKHDDASNQIRTLNSKILYTEAEIQEKENRNQLLIKRLGEFEALQVAYDNLGNKNRDLENEVKYYSESYEELKARTDKDRQVKSDEIKVLYDQIANLRTETRGLKEEGSILTSTNDRLDLENRHLRDELERKALILQTQSRELQDLKKNLDQKGEELHRKHLHNERLESENQDLNRFLEECEQKYQLAFESKEKMIRDIEALNRDNSRHKEQNKLLNKTIDELNSQLKRVATDNEKLGRICDNTERILKGLLRAVDTAGHSSPQKGDSLEFFAHEVEEEIKNLQHEKDILRKKVNEFVSEIQFLKGECQRHEFKIEKLHQEEKDYQSEIKGLRSEIEYLKDDVNDLNSKNHKAAQEFDRRQEDFERKLRDEEKQFIEKATAFEDKISRLVGEKSTLEYLLIQYREITTNHEVNRILDEARMIHSQIANLDKEALDLRVKLDMHEAKKSSATSKTSSPSKKQDTRRYVEELKDKYSEIQTNIEIYEAKKRSIEGEFMKIVNIEKQRHSNYMELEKENKQLKTEIDILLKDTETNHGNTRTLETSTYQDLLKDMKSYKSEEKATNISIVSNDSVKRTKFNTRYNEEYSSHDSEKWRYQNSSRFGQRETLNETNQGDYNSHRKKASLLL